MITEKTRQLWHIQRLGNKNSTAPKSQEHKNKISQALKGKHHTLETKQKMSLNHRTYQTPETKLKISKNNSMNNPKYRNKISIALTGRILSKETRQKIRISKQGDKSPFWHGGVWHNPYAKEFTRSYRQEIKVRDNLKCRLCNSTYRLACHHIDYNKNNYNPNNLITLCQYHHSLTNFNREYWIKYFKIIKKKNKK